MPNRLNLPEDLEQLVEKREQEDRRKAKDKSETRGESASRRMEVPKERRAKPRRKDDRA
jgi:hypothetical protein